MDSQITQVITELKKSFYQDGDTTVNSTEALKEMIFFAKEMINQYRYNLIKKRNLILERLARLNSIQDQLDTIDNAVQITGKYEIFQKDASELIEISPSFDEMTKNIGYTISSAIRKFRANRREINELNNQIVIIETRLDFYANAESELAELEAVLA